MKQFLETKIGRLRMMGFLEGLSLLALVFIAVPMKYLFNEPRLSKLLGPVHGAIFLLFVLHILSIAIEENWKFKTTTWKILLACFIPFGTIYIDQKIFKRLHQPKNDKLP